MAELPNVLDELLQVLIDSGAPFDGSEPPPAGSGNVFATVRPDEPDECVTLYVTPGQQPRRGLGGVDPLSERPRIQAVARAPEDVPALELARAVFSAFEAVVGDRVVLTGANPPGTLYVAVEAVQDPFYMGRDDKLRFLYACTYDVERQR